MVVKRILNPFALAIFVIILACSFILVPFSKIGLTMTNRIASKGRMITLKAEIYYSSSGKMVTYVTTPKKMVIINNEKGSMSVYDVEKNTVYQKENYMYSTESSQLYYFLKNKKTDLGLKSLGFSLKNSKIEEGLMVSEWAPPFQAAKEIHLVKLVHEGANPIYMDYKDKNKKIVKKIYFYNLVKVSDIEFPSAITQIDYMGKDSTITKTTYENLRLNEAVKDKDLNYLIPSNAKVVKQ